MISNEIEFICPDCKKVSVLKIKSIDKLQLEIKNHRAQISQLQNTIRSLQSKKDTGGNPFSDLFGGKFG